MLNGKVIRVPGEVQDVSVNEGSTLGDALRAANLSPTSNEEIRLNTIVSTTDAPLSEGFRIMLVQSAKGA